MYTLLRFFASFFAKFIVCCVLSSASYFRLSYLINSYRNEELGNFSFYSIWNSYIRSKALGIPINFIASLRNQKFTCYFNKQFFRHHFLKEISCLIYISLTFYLVNKKTDEEKWDFFLFFAIQRATTICVTRTRCWVLLLYIF